jgi:hypothetical protein
MIRPIFPASRSCRIKNIATKLTLPDILRYGFAYLTLLVIVPAAGWVMLLMLSDLSFTWRVMGGNPRIHRAGYYLLTSVIVVLWVSAFVVIENWFRVSVDEIRVRRARAEIGSPDPEKLPENKLMKLLQGLGLEPLSRRILIALGILVSLVALRFLCQQLLFYLAAQSLQQLS